MVGAKRDHLWRWETPLLRSRVKVKARVIVAMTSLAIISSYMDDKFGDDQSRGGRHRQTLAHSTFYFCYSSYIAKGVARKL